MCCYCLLFFFKQKTAYEMRISDGVQTCALPISDVLRPHPDPQRARAFALQPVERGGEQLAAPAAVLVFAQQVQALEFAVAGRDVREIGRASCRERVCQYV